ncbi:MAG: polysulfide reductase NrfD [Chloroflexi bacterium]|nr:polysulfide reductase NrfD [Chloroflexota bacterium]
MRLTAPYHPQNKHEGTILSPLRRIALADRWLWAVLLGVMGLGAYAYSRQWIFGMGVTGLNRPVYWGVYITNFVFFIGLAHSGTFISAILRLAGAEWRKPLTRAAEAITLFSLPFGVASILIDMGRPDRALNVIFYGRFQSPLLWDFTAVSLYLFSSVVFFYLSLLPDIALCRDRLTESPLWQRRTYELLALGWRGRPEQFHRLERVLDGMAIFMTMLVVTVHTVVSWVFGDPAPCVSHGRGADRQPVQLAAQTADRVHAGLVLHDRGRASHPVLRQPARGDGSLLAEIYRRVCSALLADVSHGLRPAAYHFRFSGQESHRLDGDGLGAGQRRHVARALHRHRPDGDSPPFDLDIDGGNGELSADVGGGGDHRGAVRRVGAALRRVHPSFPHRADLGNGGSRGS